MRVLLQGGFNVLCKGLGMLSQSHVPKPSGRGGLAHFDETRVREPPIDNAPFHTLTKLPRLCSSIHLVEAAPGGTAAILGVLRERYSSPHPIAFHLLGGIFHQGLRITKPDIRFVRRSAWMQLIEQSTEASALGLRPTQNGGPASYLGVLVHNFGCTPFGN